MYYIFRNALLCLAIVLTNMPVIAQIDSANALKLATIQFSKSRTNLSENSKRKLDNVLSLMRGFDSCNIEIRVVDNECIECNETVQKNWNRASSVGDYLLKKGWSEERIIIKYSSGKEHNAVDVYKGENLNFGLNRSIPHPLIKRKRVV